MSANDDKRAVRERMRALRAAIAPREYAEKCESIRRRLEALPQVAEARSIFTYVSIGREIDTHGMIRAWLAEGRIVLVPRIVGSGEMQAQRILTWDDLEPAAFGILAPREDRPFDAAPEVCITPCVAVTERGERLGGGAGMYDRFIAANPGMTLVAPAFELQVIETLPVERHDRRMHVVVTEDRVIDCR